MTHKLEANEATAVQAVSQTDRLNRNRHLRHLLPCLLLALCLWVSCAHSQQPHRIAPSSADVAALNISDSVQTGPRINDLKVTPAPTNLVIQLRESPPIQDALIVTHLVRRGETLSAISVKYGVSLEALTLYNRLTDPNRIQTGMTLTVPLSGLILEWPVAGVVTSSYGRRWGRLHAGIDIAAPHGTPVHAAASGRVITSGVQRGYGRIIRLRHQGGYVTVYAHHEVNLVQMGQRVQRGQLIARVGVSGSATGPHLHFEIRQAKKPQDPTLYLPSLSPTPTAFMSWR